jgi:hypothetical protein
MFLLTSVERGLVRDLAKASEAALTRGKSSSRETLILHATRCRALQTVAQHER